ncbi:MAG TPA: cytochrome P450 [Pseudonocardiaceae bacterium]|jgi:cytochrome P450|nr:cytochrome P450 [Pseudonocardiaceae bacterium]
MSSDTADVSRAGLVLADPTVYTEEGRLHQALALLRAEDPVHWVDPLPEFNPFWAVTKHADVLEIERQHELFINEPRPILATAEMDRKVAEEGQVLRTLVHIDDPRHRVMRAIGADWFRPKTLHAMEIRIRELARRYVDRLVELGGECDFVRDVSVHYPLFVILSLLGLPESDFGRMLTLTQEMFGGQDTERQRGTDPEAGMAAAIDMITYFQRLTENRRTKPTDDLASTIANARVDGELLSDVDASSYYVIIATAGHDTTSSTIAGGLHALITNPAQLDRLRAEPDLMSSAAEEMIRWVSPVKAFMRTAVRDYQLRGASIRKGESLLLSYPSANRDEEVFHAPEVFDVGRNPNRHLAFGFGAHYCLGATLARMETRAFFAELVPRLHSIELAGQPAGIATTFVGGLKRLPIRYQLTERGA